MKFKFLITEKRDNFNLNLYVRNITQMPLPTNNMIRHLTRKYDIRTWDVTRVERRHGIGSGGFNISDYHRYMMRIKYAPSIDSSQTDLLTDDFLGLTSEMLETNTFRPFTGEPPIRPYDIVVFENYTPHKTPDYGDENENEEVVAMVSLLDNDVWFTAQEIKTQKFWKVPYSWVVDSKRERKYWLELIQLVKTRFPK